jgi:hypothetical protein
MTKVLVGVLLLVIWAGGSVFLFWCWSPPPPLHVAAVIREEQKRFVGSADFTSLRNFVDPQPFVNQCSLLLPFEKAWETLPWAAIEREHDKTGFLSWGAVRQMLEVMAPYMSAVRSPLRIVKRPTEIVVNKRSLFLCFFVLFKN